MKKETMANKREQYDNDILELYAWIDENNPADDKDPVEDKAERSYRHWCHVVQMFNSLNASGMKELEIARTLRCVDPETGEPSILALRRYISGRKAAITTYQLDVARRMEDEDCTYEEIADRLDISENRVRYLLKY